MAIEFQNIGVENPYILLLIIPVAILIYLYVRRGGMNRRKRLFLASRVVVLSLLLAALSSPYIVEKIKEFQDAASIIFLYDNSNSMSIYPEDARVEDLYRSVRGKVGNITGYPDAVGMKYFSEGNRTEIGNVLYQNALKADTESNLLLLISDGNNNYGRDSGDVASLLSGMNTTIYALVPDSPMNDIYIVDIRGDKKVPADTEYRITVKVGKTGSSRVDYTLNLYVDGTLIKNIKAFQDESISSRPFTLSFSKRGPHKIVAEIIPEKEDYFQMNNRFLKSIDVVDKPNVLVASDDENSPLLEILRDGYEVTVSGNPNVNFKDYDAVFLDNQPFRNLSSGVVNSLNSYVVDGNGLVVVGGDKSYELGGYRNSDLERILPVISTEKPKEMREASAIVFLVDVSASLANVESIDPITKKKLTYFDYAKANIINLLRQLNEKDSVAIIAFNGIDAIFNVVNLTRLGNGQYVEDIVLRLKATERGGTAFYGPLLEAEKMLEDYEAKDKMIILISDGQFGKISAMRTYYNDYEMTFEVVETIREKEIKIHTINIGQTTRQMSETGGLVEDQKFLYDIAINGGGQYIKITESQRVKAFFGEEEDREYKGQYPLNLYNAYHFITQDLEVEDVSATFIKKFNGITDKSMAQLLITTSGKKPIVTAWRFGLGRVVSISTDNGREWGSNLYRIADGKLINAITNWAIGDLEKGKEIIINSKDTFIDRYSVISIDSTEVPSLVAQHESGGDGIGIGLKQIDVEQYTGKLYPEQEGFYLLRATSSGGEDSDAVAVNYQKEYSRLGVDRGELRKITGATRGLIYDMSQLEGLEDDLVRYAREGSMKEVVKKNSLVIYFAGLALLIFFIDIVIRRIQEIRRLNEK